MIEWKNCLPILYLIVSNTNIPLYYVLFRQNLQHNTMNFSFIKYGEIVDQTLMNPIYLQDLKLCAYVW